ncbi:NGG1p interacting factor 3-domain-containing protein [Obelidium mucronatum]|nr:NGG1p interacting factor 3-domain-containing protein [Obelidium mucronatum]
MLKYFVNALPRQFIMNGSWLAEWKRLCPGGGCKLASYLSCSHKSREECRQKSHPPPFMVGAATVLPWVELAIIGILAPYHAFEAMPWGPLVCGGCFETNLIAACNIKEKSKSWKLVDWSVVAGGAAHLLSYAIASQNDGSIQVPLPEKDGSTMAASDGKQIAEPATNPTCHYPVHSTRATLPNYTGWIQTALANAPLPIEPKPFKNQCFKDIEDLKKKWETPEGFDTSGERWAEASNAPGDKPASGCKASGSSQPMGSANPLNCSESSSSESGSSSDPRGTIPSTAATSPGSFGGKRLKSKPPRSMNNRRSKDDFLLDQGGPLHSKESHRLGILDEYPRNKWPKSAMIGPYDPYHDPRPYIERWKKTQREREEDDAIYQENKVYSSEDEDKQRHGPVPEELNLLKGFTENPKTVGLVLETPTPRTDASKGITTADQTQHMLLLCAANGISIVTPRNALETYSGGINYWITSGLTVEIRDKYSPILGLDGTYHYRMDRKVHPGTGAYFSLKQTKTVENLVMRLKKRIPLARVCLVLPPGTTASEKHIINIAVCAGSGYSVLTRWYPAQLYITGNMSHLELLEATSRGVVVILCENIEYCYLQKFKERLSAHINAGDNWSHADVICSLHDLVVV